MATTKHFADVNGATVELDRVTGLDNGEFAKLFPGVKGRRYDGFQKLVGQPVDYKAEYVQGHGWTEYLMPVTRAITFKSNPSKHICDARCMGAKANGACECSCGGKNHGAGSFRCE